MINRTPATMLRAFPFSRTSHVVWWLTRDFGRISTLVKGAQRPKSAFVGQYDLFYTCELLFYARERNHLHIIREASPMLTRERLRTDWRGAACASYFCDLASRVVAPDTANPDVFAFLHRALDAFAADEPTTVWTLLWAEMQFLEALGLAPRLSHCTACGRHTDPTEGANFSACQGGVVCAACTARDATHAPTLGAETWRSLQALQHVDPPRPDEGQGVGGAQMNTASALLGAFVRYHLDVPPVSRDTCLSILQTRITATRIYHRR